MSERAGGRAGPVETQGESVSGGYVSDVEVSAPPGTRLLAAVVDVVGMLVVSFVVMAAVFFASAPFVPDLADGIGADGASLVVAGDNIPGHTPGWVLGLFAFLLFLAVLVLSGAWTRGPRTSLGLRYVGLEFSLPRPARWRVALRWIVPIVAFLAIGRGGNGLVAVLVVLAGWAPCLTKARRSVYDWVAGLTLVEATEARRRILADARASSLEAWRSGVDQSK